MDFVHLHLHSEYSLLDGACRVSDIPRRAKELGQRAVALTDHGVMYGAVAFALACKEEGIKPIIGCEVYVAKRSRFDKTGSGETEPDHLVLLVKNEIGYRNLIAMVSAAYTEGFYRKPRVDLELLKKHSEGLICLSACLAGYIPRHIMSGDLAGAEEYALKMEEIFGHGNYYLELQDQGAEGQRMVNECLAGISEHTGIPMVATNDVHYLKKTDAFTQSVMMCIQMNTRVEDGRPLGFESDEFYMKSSEEMDKLFGRYDDAIANTAVIADACNFDFTFGKTFLPTFTPPDGLSANEYLKKLTYEGLERRINKGDILYDTAFSKEDYRYRIEYELVVISSMGYSPYFLIVSDFVGYAKRKEIPTGPGRGSGAGSLVAYLIGITEVDPVRFGLLFESFLNPQRVSMPDFDIDFCYRRRDEVIAYVAERYGKDHVAQIVTFGTMAAKAVLRDVGRVLGLPYSEVDAVVRALPEVKGGVTLAEAWEDKSFRAVCENDEKLTELVTIARSLEGMPRNASTHAAGVVITDRPVSDYVPLSLNGDTVVTQFDMDTVAKLGLLKFDFLALRYLTILADTEKEIRKTEPGFSLDKIPFDDPATYALISSGRTDGLFQLESEGMRQLLIRMQPRAITDIMVAIALYRPGPMDAIPQFLSNRLSDKPLRYAIEPLAQILDETCGCIVYQEQVMQIFREVAGYSYGKADIVRRAIAKKKPGVIEKEREGFVRGAVEKGYRREDAEALYEQMTDFANYGFKKSHAAAYAFISYQTAYLKAHYTPMYYAALISSVFGNQGKMSEYITECAKCGIKTLPPDINESEDGFSVSGGNIRYGLPAIKNVGEQFILRVMEERRKGKFTSFYDFLSRMQGNDLNRRQVESLIKAGAFDSLGVYRSRLLAVCGEIIERLQSRGRGGVTGQMDMFGSESVTVDYPDIPEFSLGEKLRLEKESAGMYLSGHLLDDYTLHLSALSTVPLRQLLEDPTSESYSFKEKQTVTVAGIVGEMRRKNTRNGDVMAFVSFEDRAGEIELIVFPKVYEATLSLIKPDAALICEGEISLKDGEVKLLVRSLRPLKNNAEFAASPISETVEVARSIVPPPTERRYDPSRTSAPASQMPQTPPSLSKKEEDRGAGDRVQTIRAGKLYLRVPDCESEATKRCLALCRIFEGEVPVVLYDSKKKTYLSSGVGIGLTPFVLNELKELLGEENVALK